MRQAILPSIAISLLTMSLIVSLATSKKPGDDASYLQKYGVASNCPYAKSQQLITVMANKITDPVDFTFQDFGLPNPTLDVATELETAGQVGALQRTCKYSFLTDEKSLKKIHIYTCSEVGLQVCQVSLEPFTTAPQ